MVFTTQYSISLGTFKIQKVHENNDFASSSTSSSTTTSGSVGTQSSNINTMKTNTNTPTQQIQTIADIKANGIYDNKDLLEQFKKLIANNYLYKIKLRTISKDDKNNTVYSPFVTSAIPAVSSYVCCRYLS
jgi:hypothetical protein